MDTQEIILTVILTIVGIVILRFLVATILVRGDFGRLMLTVRASLRMLRQPEFARQVGTLLNPPPSAPAKPSGEPIRVLALLQREGRLIDFLLEEIQAYTDEQVGAAVRDIHLKCQKALKEHVILEPVLARKEGDSVEVAPGFDPSAIRLTGNVTGQPPFQGTLQHHGWRLKELKLAPPPMGQDELVLQPAEVELP